MQPFTAYRRDGKLILEIDERRFLADALSRASDNLSVTDAEAFLEFVQKNIFTLSHDLEDETPPSWWLRLTQALARAGAATGNGLRRGETTIPTCGCDPEQHDGG